MINCRLTFFYHFFSKFCSLYFLNETKRTELNEYLWKKFVCTTNTSISYSIRHRRRQAVNLAGWLAGWWRSCDGAEQDRVEDTSRIYSQAVHHYVSIYKPKLTFYIFKYMRGGSDTIYPYTYMRTAIFRIW